MQNTKDTYAKYKRYIMQNTFNVKVVYLTYLTTICKSSTFFVDRTPMFSLYDWTFNSNDLG